MKSSSLYWVCIQYIVKKFPDMLFLVTLYVQTRDIGVIPTYNVPIEIGQPSLLNVTFYNVFV